MGKYRSILAVILAFVTVIFISLGNVAEAKKLVKPPAYTSEQIVSIQQYASELSALRDRMPELADLIQKQDWVFVRNFIRGPLGELRTKMGYLSQNLLPTEQSESRKLAKSVFSNLVAVDQAAQDKNYKLAIRNYSETLRDLDLFLQLVPKG
jgi:photosystem II protein PsbQ